MSNSPHHRRRSEPLVWGVILIALGILILLNSAFNLDVWDYAWKLWPLILIIWGAQKFFDGLRRSKGPSDPTPPVPPRQD